MTKLPYIYIEPVGRPKPILVSVPHRGTAFPQNIKSRIAPGIVEAPPDTDWFVHELYRFAPAMGIGLIHAHFSRYVIDLNRDPQGKKLYDDQRQETALIPTKTFGGQSIYSDHQQSFGADEIEKIKDTYYWPYYQAIDSKLSDLRSMFENALFFDAHSIKRNVPTISTAPFPDLILGNQDHKTCDQKIFKAAEKCLGEAFKVAQNAPFKGGHLTRYFGKPQTGVHAMQLEMSQDIYMDEKNIKIIHDRFSKIQEQLKKMFTRLDQIVTEL